MLAKAVVMADLASPPGNRLEAPKGERAGWHSIRVNERGRVVFQRTPTGPVGVDVVGYHQGGNGMSLTSCRRKPTSPGDILREESLSPIGMTQRVLAEHLGCDLKVVNRIVNGRSGLTAEMALKLGAAFRTTPDFWMNAKKAVDLWEASGKVGELPAPLLRAS